MNQDQSKQQVTSYNVRKNAWAIIAMVLLILDAASILLFGVIPTALVLLILAVLTIAAFVCATQIKEVSKTEELYIMNDTKPIDAKILREGLENQGFELFNKDGKLMQDDENALAGFVMSQKANHLFTRFAVNARFENTPYVLPDKVVPYAGYLKEMRNKSLSKFIATRPDKAVCGIASDLDVDALSKADPQVTLKRVTRYSVQVTDDSFNRMIINKKKISNKIIFNGRQLSFDNNGHLEGFGISQMANEIDIHALIVSSDGYVMLSRGTMEHPLRAGKVIASASCSLLPTEVADKPLQESMIDSIHNKIGVLYDIPTGTDMKSSFCGFSRMIYRGGAPEFYCVTRLDMTKDEIVAAHRDITSEFEDGLLVKSLDGIDEDDDARKAMKDALSRIKEVAGEDISISVQALVCAVDGAMDDAATAGKVMRRIGVIENENDFVTYDTK